MRHADRKRVVLLLQSVVTLAIEMQGEVVLSPSKAPDTLDLIEADIEQIRLLFNKEPE